MNRKLVTFQNATMFRDDMRYALTFMFGGKQSNRRTIDLDSFKSGVDNCEQDSWLIRDENGILMETPKLQRLYEATEWWFRQGAETQDRYGQDWPWKRFAAIDRDEYTCQDCGSKGKVHVHHKLPVMRGGLNDLTNLITLCPRCHGRAETLARKNEDWRPTHAEVSKKRRRAS